ncbi:MAG: MerR family DNA-binding transcriptional regulator [Proteobacteria bacterium]|nr:MerR family DNA-binding transcriptional regulator [Pseudomonadota bacterium]
MSSLTIGQVARQADISVETIRFYEQKGLIPKADRTESGYRQYQTATINLLKFIQRAKGVGFTLNDISDLLTLRADPDSCCADIMVRAKIKLEEIDNKIIELTRIRDSLQDMTSNCNGNDDVSDCPIIESFENTGQT